MTTASHALPKMSFLILSSSTGVAARDSTARQA